MQPGPIIVICLIALLLIGTAYYKAREARRSAERGSILYKNRLNRKPRS